MNWSETDHQSSQSERESPMEILSTNKWPSHHRHTGRKRGGRSATSVHHPNLKYNGTALKSIKPEKVTKTTKKPEYTNRHRYDKAYLGANPNRDGPNSRETY